MADVMEKQYTRKLVDEKQEQLLALARDTVKASEADATQVRIYAYDTALTRFAGSVIHQNTFERNAVVTITARIGQREGTVSVNDFNSETAAQALSQAIAAARVSPENPDLADLPSGPREYPLQAEYYEATAATTPEERAKMVVAGIEANDDPAFLAAGTLTTTQSNLAVANSNGIEAAYNTTSSKYTILWQGPDSSGYSEANSRNVRDIDTEEKSVQALATAKKSANPDRSLPAGRYTVVLAPECVATMLNFLTGLGFSGKRYVEGTSFMCGKIGEPVTGNSITIMDDPLDPRTMGLPCDSAGVPKQKLTLIESGVARAVAHDCNSAKRAGTASTGHDTGWNMPAPGNLVLMPGGSSKDELVRQVEDGIYVSRFHYTNVVNPMETVITGMTKDGTFSIKNGEIDRGLTNFRFTQNILQALANVQEMSAEQVFFGAFWGSGCLVPDAILVNDFNFSGKTEF